MGHLVRCLAKKKQAVAMSTAETEYREMAEVMHRSVYAQTLTTKFTTEKPDIIMENDNMPAITMISAIGATKRSKIIHLRHQYLKQITKDKHVSINIYHQNITGQTGSQNHSKNVDLKNYETS